MYILHIDRTKRVYEIPDNDDEGSQTAADEVEGTENDTGTTGRRTLGPYTSTGPFINASRSPRIQELIDVHHGNEEDSDWMRQPIECLIENMARRRSYISLWALPHRDHRHGPVLAALTQSGGRKKGKVHCTTIIVHLIVHLILHLIDHYRVANLLFNIG
jgi:hypothetical protein